MNERIKEFAEQAGFCHDINNGIYLCAPMHMEKFAEMIVREVLLKANGARIRGESIAELIERIKEDFGVEE